MKNGVCRVCQHNHVIVLDRFIKSKWDYSVTADVASEWESQGGNAENLVGDDLCLQAFICRSCGYTELYAPNPDPAAIVLKEGKFRELKGPEQEGPYR